MKIEYRRWIDLMSGPTAWEIPAPGRAERRQSRERRLAVRRALALLEHRQRSIIVRHHFNGESLSEIATAQDRDLAFVVRSYRSGMRVLQNLLAPLAAAEFGITCSRYPCVICDSVHRAEIEELIRKKPESESFAGIIAELAGRFAIRVRSPQTIIGHLKYHIGEREVL